ncbi:MAG: hypothetical protein K2R98_28580 [Gemmataceae bacterium]|nr:hypothetical protein [Gemmataceae bacterium]
MRTFSKVLAVMGAAILLAAPALAQFGPRGGLITNASVQKELKLSDDQIEKAKKVGMDVQAKFKDDKLGKDATPEEREARRKKVSAEMHKQLGDVLKAEQLKRYKQIELQQVGLADTDAQKELKLTDEQKGKLKTISDDTRMKVREVFKDGKGAEALEKIQKLNKEGKEKQVDVLNADQKKQWKEMTGEPFEIKFERPSTN